MELTDRLIVSLIFLDLIFVAGYIWLDRKNHQAQKEKLKHKQRRRPSTSVSREIQF